MRGDLPADDGGWVGTAGNSDSGKDVASAKIRSRRRSKRRSTNEQRLRSESTHPCRRRAFRGPADAKGPRAGAAGARNRRDAWRLADALQRGVAVRTPPAVRA